MKTLIDNLQYPALPQTSKRIFALQHIPSGKFACLYSAGVDWLFAFTDADTALEFQVALGMQGNSRMASLPPSAYPFTYFFLDGQFAVMEVSDGKR